MYYLRELGIKAKNGRKKTFYKNKDYSKVKEVFEKMCEECGHTRPYYISSDANL